MSDRQSNGDPQATGSLSVHWRVIISVLLLGHLIAILIPPFSLQSAGPAGSSPASDALHRVFHPYIQAAFLDHGYAFFAPNPGPSHLIRARMTFADGREPVEETFPDLKAQWPRLLYHRHFMLSEQLNSQYQPPELPGELRSDPIIMEDWRLRRDAYELKWRGFEDHLRQKHNADEVKLTRVRHRMIDVFEVVDQRKRLNAPDTFIDLREDGSTGETP